MKHSKEHYLLYFGNRSHYYLDVVNRYASGKKVTFNFFAFLFGVLWMFYRKMFGAFLLLCGLLVLEAVILSSLFVFFNVGPQTKMFFDRISLFFWASMLGFFSNHFYIKQADRKISKILSKNLPEEETNRRIKKSGGTTLIPHFVLIVLIAIVIALGKLGYLGGNIV